MEGRLFVKQFVLLFALLPACKERSDQSASLTTQAPRGSAAWDLNDVSVLLPLPRGDELGQLLQPSSERDSGRLIPKEWLRLVPAAELNRLAISVPQDIALRQLRAIAVRIDPCFHAADVAECRYVIRMSWQPFLVPANGGEPAIVVDAALHTFYELSREEFSQVASGLWDLRSKDPLAVENQALDVHPIMKKERYGGDFWRGLQPLLLSYCGERTLFRMTIMQLSGRTNVWKFSGFERTNDKIAPMRIPRLDARIQTIAVHAQPPFQFDGGLFRSQVIETDRLEPSAQPDFNKFLRATATLKISEPETKELLAKALGTAQFLETPSDASTSETVDCASCHIAQAARGWIQKWSPGTSGDGPQYTMPAGTNFNLGNVSKLVGLTNQLRAFGYIQKNAVVSQRVIFESAEVAARMRRFDDQ